jgi:hypothetical protein
MADYAAHRTEPAPVSPPVHRIPITVREARAVMWIAEQMVTRKYRPRNLRHDRPEVVEELAAEIARRTGQVENDVRRELVTKHGALIHYDREPNP